MSGKLVGHAVARDVVEHAVRDAVEHAVAVHVAVEVRAALEVGALGALGDVSVVEVERAPQAGRQHLVAGARDGGEVAPVVEQELGAAARGQADGLAVGSGHGRTKRPSSARAPVLDTDVVRVEEARGLLARAGGAEELAEADFPANESSRRIEHAFQTANSLGRIQTVARTQLNLVVRCKWRDGRNSVASNGIYNLSTA
jgi:hypothetical protein